MAPHVLKGNNVLVLQAAHELSQFTVFADFVAYPNL